MKHKFIKSDCDKLLEILYHLRAVQGLRQSDLANLMGVPQSFISKIESGERRIDIMTFIEICASLQVDPVEVFSKFIKKLDEGKFRIHKAKS